MDYFTIHGNTPLHLASEVGELEVVEYLIEKGAEINFPNQRAPLHDASSKGHLEIVVCLTENGANINAEVNI